MKKLPVFLALTIFFAVSIFAQTSGKIGGVVKDQNDAVIAGARVSLVNKETQKELTSVTDSGGSFSFSNLAPGAYEIRVTADGFAMHDQMVQTAAAGSDNLEITLRIGESRVTVTAELGQTEAVRDVPQAVNTISRTDILTRATTILAQAGKEQAGLNVQQTSPTIGAIVVRGLTGKNVVNYVDGVRYTNGAQRGGINTFFNLNEPTNLQTIEVLRGPNSAQYGSDSLGGTVNLLTRTPVFGTDRPEFHGEIIPTFSSADRSFGSSVYLSYGTNKLGGYANIAGRRINTLRSAGGLDSHSAITRFLGLTSDILYDRNPFTEFTQYSGTSRLNFSPSDTSQLIFFYQRSQQDQGKRFDQLLGGDGNLQADLKNLMLDFGYLRFVKQDFFGFDGASFTVSYNSQREERVNQGGQGNPFGDITHQYERTSVGGFSFFLDKQLPGNNSFLLGGDFYREKINSPAYIQNPVSGVVTISRPRIPDEASFESGGLFIQDSWEAIPNRLRITGALRYSAAFYKVRGVDAPVSGGRRLWNDDSLRDAAFSGRIGMVARVVKNFRIAFNYSRGFRYPNMTDLGTLGLTGDGFEVDYLTSLSLGGTIGTTAGTDAVTTGIPVAKQRSEISNNFDFSARYESKRFDTELTIFRLDINNAITKQALILPAGAVGQFLGSDQIVSQNTNGAVFVAAAANPVLVRANFTAARLFGLEYELEGRINSNFSFRGNYTYIHAEDKETGLPPNIEGGTPPPTAFLSFRYTRSRYWVELYSTIADKQDRLSSLDLGDRRTGAIRTRAQIENYFRRGACYFGLTVNATGTCNGNVNGYILNATGENITQVLTRVLGPGFPNQPLFTALPSYALVNLRGSFTINDRASVFMAFENIFDRAYRNPSWGIDGAGRSFNAQFRYRF
jgi:outer membrane receptor protein involved in Fe transport